MYEALKARQEHRGRLDLYHTALEVTVPEGRFVIENAWPIPDANGPRRGVVVEGAVANQFLGRFRPFRYEIRRWRNGTIADIDFAVESPAHISTDIADARRILELSSMVPRLLWGRDESELGEMWNSNSVISWLLARCELKPEDIAPPNGGRAPGWSSGFRLAYASSPKRSSVGDFRES